MINIGDWALVTTDNWFIAPDGAQYRAVYGKVRAISGDQETLGIKTNARSTNWYATIGSTLIAGCQIHYAIKTDKCNTDPYEDAEYKDGVEIKLIRRSNIYYAGE